MRFSTHAPERPPSGRLYRCPAPSGLETPPAVYWSSSRLCPPLLDLFQAIFSCESDYAEPRSLVHYLDLPPFLARSVFARRLTYDLEFAAMRKRGNQRALGSRSILQTIDVRWVI